MAPRATVTVPARLGSGARYLGHGATVTGSCTVAATSSGVHLGSARAGN